MRELKFLFDSQCVASKNTTLTHHCLCIVVLAELILWCCNFWMLQFLLFSFTSMYLIRSVITIFSDYSLIVSWHFTYRNKIAILEYIWEWMSYIIIVLNFKTFFLGISIHFINGLAIIFPMFMRNDATRYECWKF